jgi:hypothetical protein
MMILEKISDNELAGIRNLGYFPGSFDPLHDGHVEVVNAVLSSGICDAVFVYCVNGSGSYKKRCDFFERTRVCERIFSNTNGVIISYMNSAEIQKKLTPPGNGLAVVKFDGMRLTGIVGSDIALGLELANPSREMENARQQRQRDFMRGIIVADTAGAADSLSCSTSLPADDFVVALRENHSVEDVPKRICGRKVRAIIDMREFRFFSSSKIKDAH